jgi:hypothetical protein
MVWSGDGGGGGGGDINGLPRKPMDYWRFGVYWGLKGYDAMHVTMKLKIFWMFGKAQARFLLG